MQAISRRSGQKEMFFVLSGTPTVRTPEGEEQLAPGEVVYFPEGPAGWAAHVLESNGRAGAHAGHLHQTLP
jgi:uncharacterized cupin superfamily protein